MYVAQRGSQRARWLFVVVALAFPATLSATGVNVGISFGVLVVARAVRGLRLGLPLGSVSYVHPSLNVLRVSYCFEVRRAHAWGVVADQMVNVVPLGNLAVFPDISLLVGPDVLTVDPKVPVSALEC
jgi:hypothetical protein